MLSTQSTEKLTAAWVLSHISPSSHMVTLSACSHCLPEINYTKIPEETKKSMSLDVKWITLFAYYLCSFCYILNVMLLKYAEKTKQTARAQPPPIRAAGVGDVHLTRQRQRPAILSCHLRTWNCTGAARFPRSRAMFAWPQCSRKIM